ncbi:hypothetical protein ACFQU2_33265 [Siccirubricoccus deserti]
MRLARRGLLGAAVLAAPGLARGEDVSLTLLVGAAPGSAADTWTRGFAPSSSGTGQAAASQWPIAPARVAWRRPMPSPRRRPGNG